MLPMFRSMSERLTAPLGGLGRLRRGPEREAGKVSFFNISSLMAFLAWFGGTGYLLTRYSNLIQCGFHIRTFGRHLSR